MPTSGLNVNADTDSGFILHHYFRDNAFLLLWDTFDNVSHLGKFFLKHC